MGNQGLEQALFFRRNSWRILRQCVASLRGNDERFLCRSSGQRVDRQGTGECHVHWSRRSHRRVASSLHAKDKISRLGICAGRTRVSARATHDRACRWSTRCLMAGSLVFERQVQMAYLPQDGNIVEFLAPVLGKQRFSDRLCKSLQRAGGRMDQSQPGCRTWR